MIENDISKCRICLLDGKTGASLYNDENSTSYGALIKDFTGFELTQNDNLSSLICDSCISELTIVIEFITKVKTSYERFKYFNNFDDSWENNDSYSINEDDNLPVTFISAGVFTSIKDEQESKMIDDIKQESVDVLDGSLSFDNLIPRESNGVFFLNADEGDSPKVDIFNPEQLVSTFEDTIANKRLQKTPLIIEQHIENHSVSKEISRAKSVFSKTDGFHIKKSILAELLSKGRDFKKDKLKCSASIVRKRKHSVDVHDGSLSFDNLIPSESDRVFCLNTDEGDSPKADIFNPEQLVSTFEDTIANKRLQKTPLIIERHIENHSRSKEISGVKSVFSKTDGFHIKKSILAELLSKGRDFKKDKLKCSASIVRKRKHTGKLPYRCTCCTKQYIQLGSFHTHVRTLHPEEWIKMPASREEEDKEIRFIDILKHKRNDEDYVVCEYCDKSYKTKGELITHIRIHTNEKPFVCLPTSFKSHLSRARHTVDQLCWCHVCGSSFPTASKLRNHLISHVTENKYVCEYCGKSYKRKFNFIIHITSHTNEKPYVCSYCPMTFRLPTSFKDHVRARHTTERPFCCYVCGKSFAAGRYLRKHLISHTTEKKVQCNICDAFFKTKRHLIVHIRCVHSPKKNICHICGTAFSLSYNLNQHIKRRHSGQRKLESTSISLTDAGLSTGNIVVQCEVCKKPFANLEKHMKQHTDEQSFGCDICDKRFFQRKHLLQHIKKHQN